MGLWQRSPAKPAPARPLPAKAPATARQAPPPPAATRAVYADAWMPIAFLFLHLPAWLALHVVRGTAETLLGLGLAATLALAAATGLAPGVHAATPWAMPTALAALAFGACVRGPELVAGGAWRWEATGISRLFEGIFRRSTGNGTLRDAYLVTRPAPASPRRPLSPFPDTLAGSLLFLGCLLAPFMMPAAWMSKPAFLLAAACWWTVAGTAFVRAAARSLAPARLLRHLLVVAVSPLADAGFCIARGLAWAADGIAHGFTRVLVGDLVAMGTFGAIIVLGALASEHPAVFEAIGVFLALLLFLGLVMLFLGPYLLRRYAWLQALDARPRHELADDTAAAHARVRAWLVRLSG